jgi:4a-hydroxytetrahydrobiopterin dehydratase
MTEFSTLHCEACQIGAPPATKEELREFLSSHNDWQKLDLDGIEQISRMYAFDNFIDAIAFTNRIGELAETEGHHPALLTEWGRVTVRWWTHKIHGLHRNDLIMGAKSDALY